RPRRPARAGPAGSASRQDGGAGTRGIGPLGQARAGRDAAGARGRSAGAGGGGEQRGGGRPTRGPPSRAARPGSRPPPPARGRPLGRLGGAPNGGGPSPRPAVSVDDAYSRSPVVTRRAPDGTSLSSPSSPKLVAVMLEQLAVAPGQRVLEIGAATGEWVWRPQ